MNVRELERLFCKYYGYVADLEGSGVEAFDLLFVRDKIHRLLAESGPEEAVPGALFEQLHALDRRLWAERETFLMVVGEKELHQARQQQHSPRSQWWWYLDALKTPPLWLDEQRDRLVQALR